MRTVELDIPTTAEERVKRKSKTKTDRIVAIVEAERAACEAIAREYAKQGWGAPAATAGLIADDIASRRQFLPNLDKAMAYLAGSTD
jgi:hypothetical protein